MNENEKAVKPVYNAGNRIWYGTTGFFYGHGMFLNEFQRLASYRDFHKGERCFLIAERGLV